MVLKSSVFILSNADINILITHVICTNVPHTAVCYLTVLVEYVKINLWSSLPFISLMASGRFKEMLHKDSTMKSHTKILIHVFTEYFHGFSFSLHTARVPAKSLSPPLCLGILRCSLPATSSQLPLRFCLLPGSGRVVPSREPAPRRTPRYKLGRLGCPPCTFAGRRSGSVPRTF